MARFPMSAADAAWLHMDRPTNLMVVNAVLLLDGLLDPAVVESVLAERLVERYPRFRQRPVDPGGLASRPAWEDDPAFAMANHIRLVRLPEPGDDRALQQWVGEQMSVPLDRGKPLWEYQLIEGYQGGSAVLARMHHSIADGIALARVLLSLTDDGPDAGFAPPVEPADDSGRGGRLPVASLGSLASLAGQGAGLVAHPTRLIDLTRAVPATAQALSKEVFTLPDAATAFRGKNGVEKRATWSRPFPLVEVKRVAHGLHATVNDVVLAAVSGALRRYLVDRHRPVHDIRALVPFNLRPLDQPLPRELGNHFGLVFCELPLGEADPVTRVAAVHQRMLAIKDSMEPAVSYSVLETIGMTVPQIERLVVDFFTSKATAVMTNVPGPTAPVYFAGVPVRRVIGWVPRSGDIGLGISIFSYNGEITVGFSVDAGLVPDPDDVIEAVGGELDLLLGAVAA